MSSENVKKAGYHHGDLREALIQAAYDSVSENGAEAFSLADACRRAGVSTAAPYRHFKDRTEILAEVSNRGMGVLRDRCEREVEIHGEGTFETIAAMGRAYVNLAVEKPLLFRLMMGANPDISDLDHVRECGNACFGVLVDQVVKYCQAHQTSEDPMLICAELWTFVHGASMLLMDEMYERVIPGLDVETMIETATRSVLTDTKAG